MASLMSLQKGLTSCLGSLLPSFTRSLTNRAAQRPVPPIRDSSSPEDFLKAIGRASETKYSAESWESFWQTNGRTLKQAGIAVRDRRYILWCMEKYRQGLPVSAFAHEPPPKKTIRGWGPKVQNGKRIRSRRLKNQKK